ncbi:MAG TPA: GTP 3',8-cyclase MoaA [Solirubrobacteraceae bacterium]|nr:GTP 3',8-cyclase MoaA [Solirubrobacteraceae bacterium]
MPATLDRFSRPLTDLRVSVTDRCNLRCPYCMPREVFGRGFSFMARDELLTFEEIARVCRVLARLGVSKIRLTGGEPLVRRELEQLIGMLALLDGIDDIALTTNGTLLASKARALKQAGLDRVTVSLDALDDGVVRAMSDSRASLASVLAGIEAAGEAGLAPIKINTVVRRGVNDHCVLSIAEHFRHRPETLRFIEYMDVGSTNGWQPHEVVPASELIAAIAARWPLEALAPARGGEVATRYRYRDGAGEIGFIHSVSRPFCGECTRARVSADGKLFTCLFATRGTDVRAMLRGGLSDAALEAQLRGTWQARTDRYSAERFAADRRSEAPADARTGASARTTARKIEMSYIGG